VDISYSQLFNEDVIMTGFLSPNPIIPALLSYRPPADREKRERPAWEEAKTRAVLAPPLPVGRECGGRGGVGVVRGPAATHGWSREAG
jgi:hypothetical protein